MNFKLLGLMAAAALATASCTQDKKVETTTTTTPEATTTTTTTTVDTMAAYDDARRMAARVAEDLKLTDTTVVRRIERTYYTRGRKINALQTQYATDTTGRYAAIRQANDEADNAIRTDLNNPAYYNTYSSNRANYGEGPYSLVPGTVTTTTTTVHRSGGSVGQGSGVKKVDNENDGDHKVKYENGAKIKRDDDGSVKIKRADGTKIKIDENGNRTVKKGLFK
ncbi:hypothetical protein [Hymenobacter negativus]|uniref:Lipoprotein n=1 Tax=Hymenobacter negativus TaxID=2795026 RepID=A0ABS0Q5T0_9BACT|nr:MULTISPECIES: hypothetical protein [Bacteria]MBH8558014.1 hypothetical protein [Hymenobacter negativus]MBH8568504.1 hypothetical protein [Hymenobacter negativus]MBR7208238.1 hypothetical protein [Microvirga sp. STS02]